MAILMSSSVFSLNVDQDFFRQPTPAEYMNAAVKEIRENRYPYRVNLDLCFPLTPEWVDILVEEVQWSPASSFKISFSEIAFEPSDTQHSSLERLMHAFTAKGKRRKIEVLDMDRIPVILQTCLPTFVLAIQNFTLMRILCMSSDGLRDADIAELARALFISRPPLERLDLSENNFSDDGAVAISDYLRRCAPLLQDLSLGENPIGDRGVLALSCSLGPKLTEVQVGNTVMTDVGGRALVKAIQERCPNVWNLVIFNSPFVGDGTAAALTELISTSKALRFIQANNCAMSEAALIEVVTCVSARKFTSANFSLNPGCTEAVQRLALAALVRELQPTPGMYDFGYNHKQEAVYKFARRLFVNRLKLLAMCAVGDQPRRDQNRPGMVRKFVSKFADMFQSRLEIDSRRARGACAEFFGRDGDKRVMTVVASFLLMF